MGLFDYTRTAKFKREFNLDLANIPNFAANVVANNGNLLQPMEIIDAPAPMEVDNPDECPSQGPVFKK